MITNILSLVQKHEELRGKQCINLIPSENVTSPHVRSLLSSDLGHRYSAPERFYMGTTFIDEIESYGEKIARNLFAADVADLRPLSGHIADLIFLANFTKRGDILMCVSADDGGYPGIWEKGLPRILGLKVEAFPFSKQAMNIRAEEAVEKIIEMEPSVVVFGASLFLFPHPVKEVSKAAESVGALVGYDGSHVMGLIGGGEFQNPLTEGGTALFGSTHKSFFGPQGGIILADEEHGEVMKSTINPTFVDNAHWNRIAALALALAETKKFGSAYAKQVIRNSQTLAKMLESHGFPCVAPESGFTKSHQVLLDYGGYKQGREVAERLEKANLITDCGVRLGTCELTRRGMKEAEMEQIAEFINRVIVKRENTANVKEEVKKLAGEFQDLRYCFQV